MADKAALQMYADCGYHLTPLKGKKPYTPNWTKVPYDKNPDPANFPDNFGVVLQDSDLIIDVDPRNYKNNVNSFAQLQAALKWTIKNTRIPVVRTGGGGLHIYLKKPADLSIHNTLADYPGVEFKTKGSQVVGARCVHPETKMFYNIINGEFKNIPQAPKALLELLRRDPVPVPTIQPEVVTQDVQTVLRYVEYLKTAPPAIQGQSGDKTTFTVACYGRDLGLPEELTAELMNLHYNPKCQPPWSTEELATKVVNAYSYAKNSAGNLNPASDFTVVPREETATPVVKVNWDVTQDGVKKKTLNNCVNYFLVPDAGLKDIVAWDEFTDQVMLIGRAPWHPEGEYIPKDGLPWTDEDTTLCRYHLSKTKGFDIQPNIIIEAITVAAKKHPNHPVRNYLNSLIWDRTERLNTWLTEFCGVADTPYSQAVGSKVLIGAVARVFNPGVKFDYMLVLEGEQGTGKSSVVATLGGPWYGDLNINPHDKDTIAAMRGKWIIEASEMDFATRAEAQAQKAFLSRQVDVVRAAYAKLTRAIPRQCVFIGTMNLEAEPGYLKDTTGNRRFWPVTTTNIKIAELKTMRDQLFAEALYRYKNNETLYINNIEVAKSATLEQYARQQNDPWKERIAEWLDRDNMGERRELVTTMEIWTECLQGLERQLDRRNQCRIVHVLTKELGWERGSFWHVKVQKTIVSFRRPAVDPLSEGKKDVQ